MKIIYSEFSKPLDGSKPELERFSFGEGCNASLDEFYEEFFPKVPMWISDYFNRSYQYHMKEIKFTITIKR